MEKSLHFIYADLDSLLGNMSTCHHNPGKLLTIQVNQHTSSGYSLLTYCTFDLTKNKLDFNRGKDCIKRFCNDLKEHATKIINYELKKE